MTSSDTEHCLRLLLILVKGGSYVIKGILERETTKRGDSFNALLQQHRQQLKRALPIKQYDKMFPDGALQCIQDCDIDLLIKVTLQLFKTYLTVSERDKLRTIQSIRNELIQSSEASVDTYKVFQDDIVCAVSTLSKGLNRIYQRATGEIIRNCLTEPLGKAIQEHEIGQNDADIEKIIKQFQDENLRHEDDQIEVEVLPSNLTKLCGIIGKQNLWVENAGITFKDPYSHTVLYQFPIIWMRRYGAKSSLFSFEVGRKCPKGEGTVVCNTACAQRIHNLLKNISQNTYTPSTTDHSVSTTSVINRAPSRSSSSPLVIDFAPGQSLSTPSITSRASDRCVNTPAIILKAANKIVNTHSLIDKVPSQQTFAEFKRYHEAKTDFRKKEFPSPIIPKRCFKQIIPQGTGNVSSEQPVPTNFNTGDFDEYINLTIKSAVTNEHDVYPLSATNSGSWASFLDKNHKGYKVMVYPHGTVNGKQSDAAYLDMSHLKRTITTPQRSKLCSAAPGEQFYENL